VQFFFSPLAQEQVEDVLRRERADLPAAQRKIAAQMAEGSPGVALALNLTEATELRQSVFQILAATIERRSASELFAETARLVKGKNVPFEIVMELFYSFLNDLLELSAGLAGSGARNPAFSKEFGKLSRHIDTAWIIRAVEALDELSARLRRNVNRQLGLDAIALALAEETKK
jgi:hypothetical protein